MQEIASECFSVPFLNLVCYSFIMAQKQLLMFSSEQFLSDKTRLKRALWLREHASVIGGSSFPSLLIKALERLENAWPGRRSGIIALFAGDKFTPEMQQDADLIPVEDDWVLFFDARSDDEIEDMTRIFGEAMHEANVERLKNKPVLN